MKAVGSQVTEAMKNMTQSGMGDLAEDMKGALDGEGAFPDIDADEGEAERTASSSPYDFLAVGIVSHFYVMLAKDGLLLASTTMLSPAAQCSSSSGSATSQPRRKTPTKMTPTKKTKNPTTADRAGAEMEVNELGDTDGDSAMLTELAAQARAANLAAQDAADSVNLIAAALGPAMQPTTSGNLETEQVADVKAKRFEMTLDELGQLAEGSPFKPFRTRLKAKQVYSAGIAIGMTADDVVGVIAEAVGDNVGDLEDALRALNPGAAKNVFG